MLLSHLAPSFSKEKCNPQDKRALLQIKKDLNNPTYHSSWNPYIDRCNFNWKGVSCKPHTDHVHSITLISEDHPFQIPPSIGNLPYLENLFLYIFPNLTGLIPEAISKLTKLNSLTLSSTRISGPIPNFLAQIRSLTYLDLSFNNLSGALPPSLSLLHDLQDIDFDNNMLTGSIPESYGSFKKLFTLTFKHNHLSGIIPVSFAKLINLYFINLSQNRLEGDASMLFGSTKGIGMINLSRNLLAFDLGKVELPKNLTTLDGSHNQIYGNLPVGVQSLQFLNVTYNRLCGEIPQGGNLQSFNVSSYFHNKCLCGSPLPSCKRSLFLIKGHKLYLIYIEI